MGKADIRTRINNIFFAIGVIAVVVMFCTFDVSFADLWSCVRRAGYWLVAILGLWAALYAMNALSWRVIIRGGGPCDISFFRLLKYTVTGFALNNSTPVGLVGGEAYRIMALSPHVGTSRAASSVLLFAMMYILAHVCFWATSIVVYVVMALCGLVPMNAGMGVVLGLAAVLCGGAIYLFACGYRNGFVAKVIRLLGRLPWLGGWSVSFTERHRDELEKIDAQIAGLHRQNRRAFAASLALEYAGRVMQSLEVFFILLMLGMDGGGGPAGFALLFVNSLLILSFTSLFANLLGFLPLQLGGREGGFAMSVVQLGMTGGTAMYVSLICRVRELFWTVLGLALMKAGGGKQ